MTCVHLIKTMCVRVRMRFNEVGVGGVGRGWELDGFGNGALTSNPT